MTASAYASALGNNCRVLNFDKGTAAMIWRNNPITKTAELIDTFWTGYLYGQSTVVQVLPAPETVTR
jgi:hypothetical protein